MNRHTLLILFLISFSSIAFGQRDYSDKKKYFGDPPLSKTTYYDARRNSVGNVSYTITNYGRFGQNLQWPFESRQNYAGAGSFIIIGGIKESSGDTLISSAGMPTSGFALRTEFSPGRNIGGTSFDDTLSRIYLSTSDLEDWPLVDEFGENIILSDEDSYAELNDLDTTLHTSRSKGSLGIVLKQRTMVWNLLNFADAVVIEYNIINVGEENIKEMFFGMFSDPDIGSYYDDIIEWDEENEIIITWDDDGISDPRQNKWTTGYIGNAFLEVPSIVTGDPSGSTVNSIYLDHFSDLYPGRNNSWFTKNDKIDYQNLSGNIIDIAISEAADQAFYMTSSLFDIAPGDSARVILAMALGNNKEYVIKIIKDLRASVLGGWVFPEPPLSPELAVFPGDRRVTLSWSSDPLKAIDPFSQFAGDQGYRALDFQGFRIYRLDPNGDSDWKLLQQYDLIDNQKAARFGANQVRETGITFTYVDTSVINGFEYEYSVTSFDLNLDTLSFESGIEENRTSVTPRSDPSNLTLPTATIDHVAGNADIFDLMEIRILNPEVIKDATYQMIFKTVSGFNRRITGNHFPIYRYDILNKSNGDTVVSDGEIFMNVKGVPVSGTSEVFGGLLLEYTVSMHDSTRWVDGIGVSEDVDEQFDGNFKIAGQNESGRVHLKDNASAFSRGAWAFTGNDYTVEWVALTGDSMTLKVTDKQNNVEIPFDDEDGYSWGIFISNRRYERVSFSNPDPVKNPIAIYVCGLIFFFNLDQTMTVPPSPGDKWTILTTGDRGPNFGNVYEFLTTELKFEESSQKEVKAVPNPYFVRNIWEQGYDSRNIQFINLPNKATIRIYTVSGDLIKTIEHNSVDLLSGTGGTENWNLLSDYGIRVASGMYYFHVESDIGNQIGKFAIIL